MRVKVKPPPSWGGPRSNHREEEDALKTRLGSISTNCREPQASEAQAQPPDQRYSLEVTGWVPSTFKKGLGASGLGPRHWHPAPKAVGTNSRIREQGVPGYVC